jgi:glutathione S-transferase
MMELYNSAFSTCSQKVRLCLHEKGLEFVDRQLSFTAGDHLTPEYLALNPNGVLPTLVHDGVPITDSSVICEYLEEIMSSSPLMPTTAAERAKVRAWMRYIEEVPTTAVRPPSFNDLFSDANGALDRDEFEAHAERLPLRKHFYLKMNNGRFEQTEINASLERLAQTVQRMEAALETGPWLIGDMFTLADLMLIPLMVRMDDIGLAHIWNDAPRVTDWFTRVQARPSFYRTFYPGARIKPGSFSIGAVEQVAEQAG